MSLKEADILYEDNHLIAVFKQVGDIVQGDKTGDQPLSEKVKDFLRKKYDKPGNVFVGVTHRIDRPVSGVVLFAKTSKALSRTNDLFREKTAKKTYWAVVKKRPRNDEDTLIHYITRNTRFNKSYAHFKEVKNSKRAELDFKVIGASNNYTLLEIDLKTGRHHQIRVQLSAIGCPIKGDIKYGFSKTNPDGGIHLHARSISFIHPVKKELIKIDCPLPSDNLWQSFKLIE